MTAAKDETKPTPDHVKATEHSKQSFPASDAPPMTAKPTKKDGSDMEAVREDRLPPVVEKPAPNQTAERDR
jgi:hypothetical protein